MVDIRTQRPQYFVIQTTIEIYVDQLEMSQCRELSEQTDEIQRIQRILALKVVQSQSGNTSAALEIVSDKHVDVIVFVISITTNAKGSKMTTISSDRFTKNAQRHHLVQCHIEICQFGEVAETETGIEFVKCR